MNTRIFSSASFLFLLLSSVTFSQIINGVVLDSNNRPISYVNIGIVNGNQGTITDEMGNFSIDLTNTEQSEILRVSCVGFFPRDFQVSSIRNIKNLKVVLEEQVFLISEVIIKSSKTKTVEFGTKKVHAGAWCFWIGDGFELSQLYKNRDKVNLKSFMFHIESTTYDSLLFRLNIYSNKNGLPGENLNTSNIYIKTNKTGWASQDLTSNNIIIDSDFFLSVEVIKGWQNAPEKDEKIMISGKKGIRKCYFRGSSMGRWRESSISLDYYLLAEKF